MQKYSRIGKVALAGTIIIAVIGFVLSFNALNNLAQTSGIDKRLSWMWPLLVDGLIVESTLAVMWLSHCKSQKLWYAWTLFVLSVIGSVAGNITHAWLSYVQDVSQTVIIGKAIVVAGVPPLALVTATHLTVIIAETRPRPENNLVVESLSSTVPVSTGATLDREDYLIDELDTEVDVSVPESLARTYYPESVDIPKSQPSSQPVLATVTPLVGEIEGDEAGDDVEPDDTFDAVAAYVSECQEKGATPTGTELAKRLGVSRRTGSRKLNAYLENVS